jgi:selenocysteine lyase/cysteine desulfurase
LTFKPLFSLSLNADPHRLHFAAHSHHLWPDASFEGQQQCWRDAAELADSKWDKIMGEVWPEAQGHVARELGTAAPECIVFAPNTHALLVSLAAAAPRAGKLRILTSGGEFHSARRQFARWAEAGEIVLTEVAPEPFDTLAERFLSAAQAGNHDLIFISQLLFGSGRLFTPVEELAALGRPEGPWVAIDGYHAFMAVPQPFSATAAASAFYLGGGYKYAMAGEGCAFMHAPSGFGARPPITGWYAEFEDLALPQGMVGYAPDAARFLGATFDPSGLYRFNAVQRMLIEHGIDTRRATAHVAALQERFLAGITGCPLDQAALLNPPGQSGQARFLAFRDARSSDWSQQLKRRNCVTDVRGDVLRIGFGLYHDEQDVTRLTAMVRALT